MLNGGCPGSTAPRWSARLRAADPIFFEPLHLDLELAKLLVEPVTLRFPFLGRAVLTLVEDLR